MTRHTSFTDEEAKAIAIFLGVHWDLVAFRPEDLRRGMEIELEHGSKDPLTDVTHDSPEITAKIALAHLGERPDYYDRLEQIEALV